MTALLLFCLLCLRLDVISLEGRGALVMLAVLEVRGALCKVGSLVGGTPDVLFA